VAARYAEGFKAAAFNAGLRATGKRADCALIVADKPAVSVGLYKLNPVVTHSLKGAWFQPLEPEM
jgi:N-acetylglutamate synthase/N-acetylornithine aminotransferase